MLEALTQQLLQSVPLAAEQVRQAVAQLTDAQVGTENKAAFLSRIEYCCYLHDRFLASGILPRRSFQRMLRIPGVVHDAHNQNLACRCTIQNSMLTMNKTAYVLAQVRAERCSQRKIF